MEQFITAIDLGSNSFRVLQFDCINHKEIAQYEKAVGLADGLKETKIISKEAIKRLFDAIDESIKLLRYEPKKAIAVTTQAMRSATNALQVKKEILKYSGINFQIITPTQEAQLTFLAIFDALKKRQLPDDNFILLDIGGGSTELILYQDQKKFIQSFPYGIVTLTQSDTKEEDFKILQNLISVFLEDKKTKEAIFVATAGTPTTLAALKHKLTYQTYDKTMINGTTLLFDEVKMLHQELKNCTKEQLIDKVGSGRYHYIDTGIKIFTLIYKMLDKKEAIIFDDGLREGVAIEYCNKKALFN